MNPRRIAPLLTLVPLTLAACGGDDGGGGGGLAAGDDYSVAGALAQVPAFDGDGLVVISTGDVVAASEANGVERPTDADDPDWYQWMNAISGGVADDGAPIFVAPPTIVVDGGYDPAAYAEIAGFSFTDADVFVSASAPPDDFTAYGGDAIAEAELDEGLTEVADDVVSNNDADDYEQDIQGERIVDRLGRGVRFAARDGQIAATLSTPMAEAWAAGDDDTMGADESLAAVAEALDDADVISATIFDFEGEGPGLDDRVTPELRERVEADGLAAPFGSLGLGWAADDDGDSVITAVYDFGDEDVAADMVEVLEDAYRDGTSLATDAAISDFVELDEIEARGGLVVATLHLGPDGRSITPYQMVMSRDLPFASS